jgi:hypothetical protein
MRDDQQKTEQGPVVQEERQYPVLINGEKVYSAAQEEEIRKRSAAHREACDKAERDRWLATRQGQLCLEFYQKFQEYKAHVREHPRESWRSEPKGPDFTDYELMKEALRLAGDDERERKEEKLRYLRQAHLAARCDHRHADGRRCGSPRVRGKQLCHWHDRLEDSKALKFDLGLMEDPDSIQVAIMKLQRAVIDGALDSKQTGQLAYLIQLAAWNVTRMSRGGEFEEAETVEDMIEGG